MSEDKKPALKWKECIIFGIVNILLVLLATKLNILLISTLMILLIIVGISVSAQYIKEEWKKGYKVSAVGCGVGLLLHCGAGVLYVINILTGVIGVFVNLFMSFSK